MNIPNSIKNAVTKSPMDRTEFYNAEEMWNRLCIVKAEKVPFIKQDMAMLANTVELYYKGLILASGIKVSDHLMCESHSLYALTNEIENRIMPLSAPLSRTEERDRRNFLMDLSSMYIDARYRSVDVDFDEFKTCMEWAENQIRLIKESLLPPKNEEPSWDELDRQ